MADRPLQKRQRVAKACDSCRGLKSKCDGVQPVCGRCLGYGHTCIWSDGFRKQHDADAAHTPTASSHDLTMNNTSNLKIAIQAYDKLVQDTRVNLPENDRAAIDLTLSYIKSHLLPKDVFETIALPSAPSAEPQQPFPSNEIIIERVKTSQRYLGEASDIKFLHELRQVLGDDETKCDEANMDEQDQENMETYEQEESHRAVITRKSLKLPPKALADTYLTIYFTTIHIAYPFVNEILFRRRYDKLYETQSSEELDLPWLVLLFTLFGIGAYYTSFAQPTPNNLPFDYYQQALEYESKTIQIRSIDNINATIARCFFLLATCQTGKCWITLGTAVRLAQSMGLHVKDLKRRYQHTRGNIKDEMRRRTWYSIYVLDRLLALQLGRPPAIHADDYNVDLPARLDDTCFNYAADTVPEPTQCDACFVGDYFLAVIDFSHIIYYVIHELYSPSQILKIGTGLRRTTGGIDEKLQAWRGALHRTLRFDLSHTFDKSIKFKTQRNNLAIKYHHLRTLVYRPYLYLSDLSDRGRSGDSPLDASGDAIEKLQRECISESQATARLLHSLPDEKALVQGFPWWQMVSCLLTACSVLLVADRIVDDLLTTHDMRREILEEDANTCLQVFDALSNNSQAARVAGTMMKNLKKNMAKMRKIKSPKSAHITRLKQDVDYPHGFPEPLNGSTATGSTPAYQNPLLETPEAMYETLLPAAPSFDEDFTNLPFNLNDMDPDSYVDMEQWRNQLSSSLMWTENFIDGTQSDFQQNFSANYGL